MTRALNLQTFGAVLVLFAFIAAEIAASHLASHPGSALAWSLNMGLFRVFEYARAEPSPARHLFGPYALSLASIALGLVLVARLQRWRFAVALAANLSFAFAIALAYSATMRLTGAQTASAIPVLLRPDATALILLMLAGSCMSFVVSHTSFLSAVMSERTRLRG